MTIDVAALNIGSPKPLEAVQWYFTVSLGLLGLSTLDRVRLADSESTARSSFFVHFSEGLGTPVASQMRVTLEPLRTCEDCGDTVTSGGTTETKIGKKQYLKLAMHGGFIKIIIYKIILVYFIFIC